MPQSARVSLWLFLARAMRLRCPECGIWPMFRPLRDTRSLFDWFTPLDGCPRCGYSYRREPGYFLISICVLNYGLIAGLALIGSFIIDEIFHPPMWVHAAYLLPLMPLASLLIVRHAKSLFIAIDHYFDPHAQRSRAIH